MFALIIVSVAHDRALDYLFSSSCEHIVRSEKFMGLEFYEPHIKPNSLYSLI